MKAQKMALNPNTHITKFKTTQGQSHVRVMADLDTVPFPPPHLHHLKLKTDKPKFPSSLEVDINAHFICLQKKILESISKGP